MKHAWAWALLLAVAGGGIAFAEPAKTPAAESKDSKEKARPTPLLLPTPRDPDDVRRDSAPGSDLGSSNPANRSSTMPGASSH